MENALGDLIALPGADRFATAPRTPARILEVVSTIDWYR
jgi:hypothetical protein